MPSLVPLVRAQTPSSVLKPRVWFARSNGELSTITSRHFGRIKSRATTPCGAFPGLLLARSHQRRSSHQKSLRRQARRTRRDDESRGAAAPRPRRVRQTRACARSFHLCVLLRCMGRRTTLMYQLGSLVNVESEGPYEPQRLPIEAIRVMREKISALKTAAEALRAQGDPGGGDIQMANT